MRRGSGASAGARWRLRRRGRRRSSTRPTSRSRIRRRAARRRAGRCVASRRRRRTSPSRRSSPSSAHAGCRSDRTTGSSAASRRPRRRRCASSAPPSSRFAGVEVRRTAGSRVNPTGDHEPVGEEGGVDSGDACAVSVRRRSMHSAASTACTLRSSGVDGADRPGVAVVAVLDGELQLASRAPRTSPAPTTTTAIGAARSPRSSSGTGHSSVRSTSAASTHRAPKLTERGAAPAAVGTSAGTGPGQPRRAPRRASVDRLVHVDNPSAADGVVRRSRRRTPLGTTVGRGRPRLDELPDGELDVVVVQPLTAARPPCDARVEASAGSGGGASTPSSLYVASG